MSFGWELKLLISMGSLIEAGPMRLRSNQWLAAVGSRLTSTVVAPASLAA